MPRRPVKFEMLSFAVALAAVPILAHGQSTPFRASNRQAQVAFPDEWFFGGAGRPGPLRALEGQSASELSIQSWIGNELSVEGSRGKVIVVDFWATWCGPCIASIPHNIELVEKYADRGLVFVGVHDSNAGWEKAPRTVTDFGINYSVGVDKSGGESVKAYSVQFWPTYVVIDRAGVVRAAGLTPDRVEDVVSVLLDEPAPEDGAGEIEDEFEPAFYYGGDTRPLSMRAMRGKPRTPLKSGAWLGLEPAPGIMDDSVVVLTFVSPAFSVSMSELDRIAQLEPELGPQGVVFLAICDGRAEWERVEERAKMSSLSIPIMRDAVETRVDEDGAEEHISVTAAEYGVEFYPTTLVIDRSGTIRAAGVRATKVKEVVEKLLGEAVGRNPATE